MVTFVDSIIPDSSGDFGVILFWVLMIPLVILIIIDIRIYLNYRKTSKKTGKLQQNLNTIEQIKKSEDETIQEYVDIRNKVDNIIEINRL